ncbi:SMI1/KNR4 family protein [Streptomyces sp. CAU 1734]|uniref:SMI1/KNR4 family protein n=1 Tax=Streptomyces sp. CAU 1734 TaxID=3140360 RepID=UPI003260C8FA
MTFDRELPLALAAAAEAEYEYDDGDGVDFEPYEAFLSADDTTSWIRSWTGNGELTGEEFLVFGQDGTGGFAALWLIRPGADLVSQPVVFLGSEGDTGVVARDVAAYLWLLADGYGPFEAVESPGGRNPRPHEELLAIAERYAPGGRRSAEDVIAEAAREFPDFQETIEALCR